VSVWLSTMIQMVTSDRNAFDGSGIHVLGMEYFVWVVAVCNSLRRHDL